MRSIYVNVPFVGEAHVEINGVTHARKGYLIDAALNPGCVEFWAGPVHLTLDAPRKRPSLVFVAVLVAVALFIEPQTTALARLMDRISTLATEQAPHGANMTLEPTYPSAQ